MTKELLNQLWSEYREYSSAGGENDLNKFLAWLDRRLNNGHYKTKEELLEDRLKHIEGRIDDMRKLIN